MAATQSKGRIKQEKNGRGAKVTSQNHRRLPISGARGAACLTVQVLDSAGASPGGVGGESGRSIATMDDSGSWAILDVQQAGAGPQAEVGETGHVTTPPGNSQKQKLVSAHLSSLTDVAPPSPLSGSQRGVIRQLPKSLKFQPWEPSTPRPGLAAEICLFSPRRNLGHTADQCDHGLHTNFQIGPEMEPGVCFACPESRKRAMPAVHF